MEILKCSFELNTNWGIAIHLPSEWWDDDGNRYAVIERAKSVTVNVEGKKDVVLRWIWNLGKDGHYQLISVTH